MCMWWPYIRDVRFRPLTGAFTDTWAIWWFYGAPSHPDVPLRMGLGRNTDAHRPGSFLVAGFAFRIRGAFGALRCCSSLSMHAWMVAFSVSSWAMARSRAESFIGYLAANCIRNIIQLSSRLILLRLHAPIAEGSNQGWRRARAVLEKRAQMPDMTKLETDAHDELTIRESALNKPLFDLFSHLSPSHRLAYHRFCVVFLQARHIVSKPSKLRFKLVNAVLGWIDSHADCFAP